MHRFGYKTPAENSISVRYAPPVLIDEIQYAPKLLPYIKIAVDTSQARGAFWLTGSQHFHLMKGVTESLAGRVALVHLLGFSRREVDSRNMGLPPFLPRPQELDGRLSSTGPLEAEAVYKHIWTGSFPALHAGGVQNRGLFYSSYLQTYVQRNVRDLSQVGDEAAFVRFIKACAARTAQMLNLTELARDIGISVKTAKAWLSILEASFQVMLVQPYHSNVTQRLIKTPKMYFLDTGLCAYLTEWSSPETLAAGAMSSAIFETFVFTEMLKSWWHRLQFPNLYYYRDKDGREIDFVFEQDQTLFPVEAKRGATPNREWAGSFGALERLGKSVGDGAVICLCKEMLPLTRKVNAVPVGVI